MPVETISDELVFMTDFGQSVTLTPQFGTESTFTAIFDNEHQMEDAGGGIAFSVLQPRLTCRTRDVSNVAYGDNISTIVNGAIAYFNVTVIMPDGTGMTELRLERQPDPTGLVLRTVDGDVFITADGEIFNVAA